MSRYVLALYARGPSGEVILNWRSMCWCYGWIFVHACVRVGVWALACFGGTLQIFRPDH